MTEIQQFRKQWMKSNISRTETLISEIAIKYKRSFYVYSQKYLQHLKIHRHGIKPDGTNFEWIETDPVSNELDHASERLRNNGKSNPKLFKVTKRSGRYYIRRL